MKSMSEEVINADSEVVNSELDHVVADEPEPVEEVGGWEPEPELPIVVTLDSKQNGDKPIMDEKPIDLEVGEIIIPEESNVRPVTAENPSEKEQESIEALAKSIELHGQLQPVRVMEKISDQGEVTYHLIMGRRRVQAIASLSVPRKVKAIVVPEQDSQATFEQALAENIQREDINPIDMLENIKRTREQFKLKGAKNTPKIAAMFGVSPATIHQYEKFETLDEETKGKVRSGEVSREGAFLLVGRLDAPEIVRKAKEIQEVEESKRPVKGKAEAKTKPVKARHIRKVVRESDSSAPIARGIKDVMEWFEGLQGPAFGYEDGAVYQFVEALKGYRAGSVGDRALLNKFSVMVEKAYKGSAPKSEGKREDGKGKVEVKVARKVRNKK